MAVGFSWRRGVCGVPTLAGVGKAERLEFRVLGALCGAEELRSGEEVQSDSSDSAV